MNKNIAWTGDKLLFVYVAALLKEIDSLAEDYLNNVRTMSGEMRKEHLAKIEKLFSKSKEFGDDKVQLAMQTYEMVNWQPFHLNCVQYSVCGMQKKLNCVQKEINQTRMWANAQRDGRPAEHRWCLLFNAAKFGWHPLLDAVQQRCQDAKLPNRSQPLVGRNSPYYENMWRTYCCLTSFFRLSICALVAKI